MALPWNWLAWHRALEAKPPGHAFMVKTLELDVCLSRCMARATPSTLSRHSSLRWSHRARLKSWLCTDSNSSCSSSSASNNNQPGLLPMHMAGDMHASGMHCCNPRHSPDDWAATNCKQSGASQLPTGKFVKMDHR